MLYVGQSENYFYGHIMAARYISIFNFKTHLSDGMNFTSTRCIIPHTLSSLYYSVLFASRRVKSCGCVDDGDILAKFPPVTPRRSEGFEGNGKTLHLQSDTFVFKIGD